MKAIVGLVENSAITYTRARAVRQNSDGCPHPSPGGDRAANQDVAILARRDERAQLQTP